MDISRRKFLRGGLAAGVALVGSGRALAGIALNGKPKGESRDVVAVGNMIQLGLFGEVMHCVGGAEHLLSIEMFLGIGRGDWFTQRVRVESGQIVTTFLKTARGKTVTLNDDRSADGRYARMFRVEGTGGIWMQDQNRIHLGGISPPNAWEDFGLYRWKYGGCNTESPLFLGKS
jgi:hypothetical protein